MIHHSFLNYLLSNRRSHDVITVATSVSSPASTSISLLTIASLSLNLRNAQDELASPTKVSIVVKSVICDLTHVVAGLLACPQMVVAAPMPGYLVQCIWRLPLAQFHTIPHAVLLALIADGGGKGNRAKKGDGDDGFHLLFVLKNLQDKRAFWRDRGMHVVLKIDRLSNLKKSCSVLGSGNLISYKEA